jgi:hypothetical protein
MSSTRAAHRTALLDDGAVGDTGAERKACAIGTNMGNREKWMDGSREEFKDAIKTALEDTDDECSHPVHHDDD